MSSTSSQSMLYFHLIPLICCCCFFFLSTFLSPDESDFFRGETADDSPKVWDPHFSAHGKESCDSYDVEEESSSSVVCDPGCSAKPEVFRARGTTAELTVVECSDTGEESVPHPVRKTTADQDWKSNLHRGSNPDTDRFLPQQNQDVEQRTCLPTGAEPHHTNTSAFCQIVSKKNNHQIHSLFCL